VGRVKSRFHAFSVKSRTLNHGDCTKLGARRFSISLSERQSSWPGGAVSTTIVSSRPSGIGGLAAEVEVALLVELLADRGSIPPLFSI
jgi:hypothetical protein